MFRTQNVLLFLLLCGVNASFVYSQQAEVGFDDLEALIGAANLEDGTGVTAAQVEAPPLNNLDGYLANPNSFQFNNTVFVDATGTNSGQSSHASEVGFRMYGTLSMASGLGRAANPITGYESVDFILNSTGIASGRDPEPFDFNLANHSYILYQSETTLTTAQIVEILQRFDFMANQSETTHCVGLNNGSTNPLPELWASSYNAISVGRTNGNHSAGITSIYGDGRTKPEIVAPESATSFATPMVAASAAILHEAGSGSTATRSETIRALLLSGATKDEFSNWERTTTRPLDEVFGAGELNIYNSYMSLQGGEFDSSTNDPATPVDLNGWDYQEEIVAGNDLFYEFEVAEGTQLDQLSIVLCWNMDIIDSRRSAFSFRPQENLGDLNLDFYDSTGSFMGSLIDESKSTVDNVEHIYLLDLPAGTYHLKVSSDTTKDFGLAWRSSSSDLILGDVNQDGFVDFSDIPLFVNILMAGTYQYEGDLDHDGFVDFNDIPLFVDLLLGVM